MSNLTMYINLIINNYYGAPVIYCKQYVYPGGILKTLNRSHVTSTIVLHIYTCSMHLQYMYMYIIIVEIQ